MSDSRTPTAAQDQSWCLGSGRHLRKVLYDTGQCSYFTGRMGLLPRRSGEV